MPIEAVPPPVGHLRMLQASTKAQNAQSQARKAKAKRSRKAADESDGSEASDGEGVEAQHDDNQTYNHRVLTPQELARQQRGQAYVEATIVQRQVQAELLQQPPTCFLFWRFMSAVSLPAILSCFLHLVQNWTKYTRKQRNTYLVVTMKACIDHLLLQGGLPRTTTVLDTVETRAAEQHMLRRIAECQKTEEGRKHLAALLDKPSSSTQVRGSRLLLALGWNDCIHKFKHR